MFADSVMESSSTTGTGSYTLVGAVGYSRTFAQDFADGDTVAYFVSNLAKTKWEFCTGTLTIGPPRTLTRAVRKSSNAGSAIDWQASDVYYVFSIASADALAGLLAGNLAAARPWWVRTGARWWDHAAGLAVSWIDRLATGAASNTRIGVYDVVKDTYFADGRRPWAAIGAANKTIAAADIGGIFTQNNAAADRTFTLPAHDAAGLGHGFKVGGLGLSSGQYGIVLTPAAGDGIDGGADGATKRIPGGVRFDVEWDEPGDTWRVSYLNSVPALRTGRRQTVAAGPVSSAGLPTFLPSTNATLSLMTQNVTSAARFVATAANGWDWQGRPNDRVGVSLANLQWTGLTANRAAATPNFLYVAVGADGALTPGSTILAPVYQEGGTPGTANGQFTFNIGEMKGYLGNGSTAAEAFVVMVGEAATDGSGVISTVAYAYNGRFVSAFTTTLPGAATFTSANHNLGIKPNVAKFIVENVTPEHGYSAGDQITEGHASAYSTLYIPMPVVTTSNLIGIQLGQSAGYVVTIRTSGVTTASVTPGSWKYAFVADRGWG